MQLLDRLRILTYPGCKGFLGVRQLGVLAGSNLSWAALPTVNHLMRAVGTICLGACLQCQET